MTPFFFQTTEIQCTYPVMSTLFLWPVMMIRPAVMSRKSGAVALQEKILQQLIGGTPRWI